MVSRRAFLGWAIATPVLALADTLLAACGASEETPTSSSAPATTLATSSPAVSANSSPACYANELGQVLVLEYHRIDDSGNDFTRSAQKFRSDLQWLYDHDFHIVPPRDYFRNQISAPAGKRIAVLTFDDGVVSQFRYLVSADGTKTLDPECAIVVMEDFFSQHPDFGRGALFSILPLAPFSWPDAPDQLPFATEKLRWLLDHGYEIGNHTLDHVDLSNLPDEQVKKELAASVDKTQEYVPDAQIELIAVPFGGYPAHDSLLRGFEYGGKQYTFLGALKVGGNPAVSPADPQFDPLYVARIQANDSEMAKWFGYVEDNPGKMYVSNGDPATGAAAPTGATAAPCPTP